MMILPSLPAILTPRMIHTQQKYLLWLQRKNVPSVRLEVPDCWQNDSVTQHTQGCRDSTFGQIPKRTENMSHKNLHMYAHSSIAHKSLKVKAALNVHPPYPDKHNAACPHCGILTSYGEK